MYIDPNSKKFVALSIVMINGIARGGVRNNALRQEIHGSTAETLIRSEWITRKLVGKNTFYHITDKGRDAYIEIAGPITRLKT